MILVEKIYACNEEDLQERLNEFSGRIISVEYLHDDWWRVIIEK